MISFPRDFIADTSMDMFESSLSESSPHEQAFARMLAPQEKKYSRNSSGMDHEEEIVHDTEYPFSKTEVKASHEMQQKKSFILGMLDQLFLSQGIENKVLSEHAETGVDKTSEFPGLSGLGDLRIEITNTQLQGCLLLISGNLSRLYVTFAFKKKKQKTLLEKWLLKLRKHMIPALPSMQISFFIEQRENCAE